MIWWINNLGLVDQHNGLVDQHNGLVDQQNILVDQQRISRKYIDDIVVFMLRSMFVLSCCKLHENQMKMGILCMQTIVLFHHTGRWLTKSDLCSDLSTQWFRGSTQWFGGSTQWLSGSTQWFGGSTTLVWWINTMVWWINTMIWWINKIYWLINSEFPQNISMILLCSCWDQCLCCRAANYMKNQWKWAYYSCKGLFCFTTPGVD